LNNCKEDGTLAYKIIGDSCTDMTAEMKQDTHFHLVPLTLQVGEARIVDDETFDQEDFLRRTKESPACPKSSCPSPEDYMKLYGGEEDVYVVTLSANLSGSYNSAELARKLYLEEKPHKNIKIFNSCSASVGQTLIAKKIQELIESGKSFEEVVSVTEKFREELKTKFVLENLDTLRKNGRLNNLQAIICSALNIKPVMGSNPDGTICKIDQARGIQKALMLMVKTIEQDAVRSSEKILAIAHCNNYERAVFVKEEVLKRVPFKDSFIVDTAGVSSMYAENGGIIVCY
jgi:EDD domain protein, DegV family